MVHHHFCCSYAFAVPTSQKVHVTFSHCPMNARLSSLLGLHVGIAMFTGYLMGYFAFRALFNHSPAMSAAGGILGLVIAMLVETLLFIIKTSSLDKKPARKATSFTTTQKKNQ
ncbi:hypothetical protein MTR67_036747 [Solanum verrucosum]|uniref:Uncharacterized protein n=1 Tax=Solanum verrucosum TaxID=315347 RepID=A0AAF0UCC4_SOLVR|nr:hypothetical protein MTR67_036747 [Solanum verrucosum]